MAISLATLETWRNGQNPKLFSRLRPRGIETAPLHISASPVRKFIPRIPLSCAPGEDQTVARICCALSLENCFKGAAWNFKGTPPKRFHVYGFNENAVIDPTPTLTQEPSRNGEVWIVPHRLSNWDLTPESVGQMRLHSHTENLTRFTYILQTYTDVILNDEQTLGKGWWRIGVHFNGNNGITLSYDGESNSNEFGNAANVYSVIS